MSMDRPCSLNSRHSLRLDLESLPRCTSRPGLDAKLGEMAWIVIPPSKIPWETFQGIPWGISQDPVGFTNSH